MSNDEKPTKHLDPRTAQAYDRMGLEERMTQLVQVAEIVQQAQAEKDYLVRLLLPDFEGQGWKSKVWDGKRLTRKPGTRSTIHKDKLLERGVAVEDILYATTTTAWWTISVGDAGGRTHG